MLAFERTHLLSDDLKWLPRWLKALRWTVAGTVWTALSGAAVAVMAFRHEEAIFLGPGLTAIALGGAYAGDKVARDVLRRRLARLARGDVDLKRLKNQPDGELVHVKGRVKLRERVAGKLGGEGAY